jgi:hypothetical protein
VRYSLPDPLASHASRSFFFCESSLLRINQRHHSLRTRLWYTHHQRQRKTDGGKHPRARSGGGRGQGQSLWIDLCVPSAPPETPRLGAPSLHLLPPPKSPGSHTRNSSHWAQAWDAGSAGCIERSSPDFPFIKLNDLVNYAIKATRSPLTAWCLSLALALVLAFFMRKSGYLPARRGRLHTA